MKKTLIYAAIALTAMGSCSKEVSISQDELTTEVATTAAITNGVNAVSINESANFVYFNYIWNPCTNEWIELQGTGHYQLHGMISDNKITYVLHFNLSNVKGVGLTSATQYVTTQTFNYSNTDSFIGEQFVYQQSASMNFAAPGRIGSFSIINDWHLTVNANGDETFFFTTGGDVVICQ